jgi:hypothetical protein
MLPLNIERRRRVLGFEGDERRSPIQAGTGSQNTHAAEIFLRAKKPGDEPGCATTTKNGQTNPHDSLPHSALSQDLSCSYTIGNHRRFGSAL